MTEKDLTTMASSDRLRIVMVGKTGVGKSATGNTILGDRVFKSELNDRSVTVKCLDKSANVSGFNFTIVDTPGLFDTSHSEKEIITETGKCVTMLAPGPHAFLIVVSVLRFTVEEQQTIQRIQEIFGPDVATYAIVVFTRADDLLADGVTIDQFVSKAGPELKKFLEKCGGRYHAINNRVRDPKQVADLLWKVHALYKANSSCYTSLLFDLATKVKEQEKRIEEEKKKSSRWESWLPDFIKKRDEEMKILEDEIRALRAKQMEKGTKCTIS